MKEVLNFTHVFVPYPSLALRSLPKSKKNPEVETSFLPDKDREAARKKEERRLKQEWLDLQEKIKQEKVSYFRPPHFTFPFASQPM